MKLEDYRAHFWALSGYIIRVAVAMAIMSLSSVAFAMVYFAAVGQPQRDNHQNGEDGSRAKFGHQEVRCEDWTFGDAIGRVYPGAEDAELRDVRATVGRRLAIALLMKGDLNSFSAVTGTRGEGLLRGSERHKKLKRPFHNIQALLRFN